jgi:hypothetical protein
MIRALITDEAGTTIDSASTVRADTLSPDQHLRS